MTRFYTIVLKCMQSGMNGPALSHRWKLQEIKLKLVSIRSIRRSLTVTKKKGSAIDVGITSLETTLG